MTCLDADTLEPEWVARDRSLGGQASLVASADRVLVCTQAGELVLIDARAEGLEMLSRCRVLPDDGSTLAHPAVAAGRIYVRGPGELVCIDLRPDDSSRP